MPRRTSLVIKIYRELELNDRLTALLFRKHQELKKLMATKGFNSAVTATVCGTGTSVNEIMQFNNKQKVAIEQGRTRGGLSYTDL